ncbi:hypothetical protein ACTM8Z_09705 [Atopobiaceae bacterium HCP3S3_D6]
MYRRSAGPENQTELSGSTYLPVSDTVASMLNPNVLLLSFLNAHPGLRGCEEISKPGEFFQNGLIISNRVQDR